MYSKHIYDFFPPIKMYKTNMSLCKLRFLQKLGYSENNKTTLADIQTINNYNYDADLK